MVEPVVHAPEFNPNLTWLNTPRKLTLRELRGQIIVLDFWTYCCVNCMHVLPVLRQIEEHFANEPLVVIGVHSAKFDGEKNPERIRAAIGRYDIHHPIVVDEDMDTWSRFAIRSWPTLVVLRPDGTIAAVAPGEPELPVLLQFLEEEMSAAKKRGTLAKGASPLLFSPPEASGPLSYPGKVARFSGAKGGLVAISDSAHHRVLVTNDEGEVLHSIGRGLAGHGDGSLEEALFDDPQGLAWKSATELFVADARAHTIALVNLATRKVTTIAGTGELGLAPLRGRGGALATALRSPWDLALRGDELYVAMAGSHQIARVRLAAGVIELVAGTGAESIVDGPFEVSTFSQPSGLCFLGNTLYVADSETSAVRALDLDSHQVRTVVGVGLFDFGDIDGPKTSARLQHCLDVAALPDGELLVADTYNNKLKRVNPTTGETTTFALGLKEPAGLAFDEESRTWLVADTNAHRIARFSESGAPLAELTLKNAPSWTAGRAAGPAPKAPASSSAWFNRLVVANDANALAPGVAKVRFRVPAPDGKKFADGARFDVSLEVSRRSDLLLTKVTSWRDVSRGSATLDLHFDVQVERFAEERIESELVVRVDAIVCPWSADAANAVCEPHVAWFRIPVRLAQAGGHAAEFVTEG